MISQIQESKYVQNNWLLLEQVKFALTGSTFNPVDSFKAIQRDYNDTIKIVCDGKLILECSQETLEERLKMLLLVLPKREQESGIDFFKPYDPPAYKY